VTARADRQANGFAPGGPLDHGRAAADYAVEDIGLRTLRLRVVSGVSAVMAFVSPFRRIVRCLASSQPHGTRGGALFAGSWDHP
jgi:hypothetical protein